MKIRILGFGAVVKEFLEMAKNEFSEITFEIFHRSPSMQQYETDHVIFNEIENYIPDKSSPTFCCCSINEENLLRNTNQPLSRLSIAKPNLILIKKFIRAGYFNHGLHFILTNPSDLITEFIIQKTNNQKVFALGLSIDYVRYKDILKKFHLESQEFALAGNHWDFPLINFPDSFAHHPKLLIDLMNALKTKVKSEFQGFKPPVTSGATALYHAVSHLYYQTDLLVSGYIKQYHAVGAGVLNTKTLEFYHSKINATASDLLNQAMDFHRHTYRKLIDECHENFD